MSELVRYEDCDTHAVITRLTSYRAHSNHLYFTNNCFYDDGKRIVFESDRGNALNYFSMELETGKIEQLTDLAQQPYPAEFPLHEGFVDNSLKMCLYTDHQIFDRYRRYRINGEIKRDEQMTVAELNALKMGDYVVHIDHGVGRFGGLV